jgi:hypothetical protein
MSELFQRIGLAFKCFFVVLFAGRLPAGIPHRYFAEILQPSTAPPADTTVAQPPRAPDRAVQLLALFQRDGRLVDFLREDIAVYPDDQVGIAAREVHAACRKVLDDYFAIEPVMPGEEGRPTVVEPGFDLACIKLVGSVTGKPPFRGILRHQGWRVRRVDLPSVPDDAGRHVIAPAEVEIG